MPQTSQCSAPNPGQNPPARFVRAVLRAVWTAAYAFCMAYNAWYLLAVNLLEGGGAHYRLPYLLVPACLWLATFGAKPWLHGDAVRTRTFLFTNGLLACCEGAYLALFALKERDPSLIAVVCLLLGASVAAILLAVGSLRAGKDAPPTRRSDTARLLTLASAFCLFLDAGQRLLSTLVSVLRGAPVPFGAESVALLATFLVSLPLLRISLLKE